MSVVSVGRYERELHASLARVWENVLDWEHLPWLHRATFAAIRLQSRDAGGWRADVTLRDGRALVLDVTIDRAAGRYHSRTLAGAGAGTDIVTTLTPRTPDRTAVAVEFLVPDVPPAHVAAVGAYYRTLYTQLWDEDEGMMRRRQRVLDAAPPPATLPGVDLGARDDLLARLPCVVPTAGGPVRIVRLGDDVVAHTATCPHLGGPLDDAPIDADGCITCPWHGYRFALADGGSTDGRGLRLAPPVALDTAPDGRTRLRFR